MKNSNRINHNKILDIDVISNLLNYELRSSKIIRPLTDNIHFKILIPCAAAGAIIGKGGEAIAIVQKESGAKVKISKSYDFYPGTTERICLIMGNMDSVTRVHDYIIDKIQEKPDQLSRQIIDGKGVVERHKQVKILVPNSTAGMIIGKSGCYIKEIKDKTGSFIQISQKSKEINLSERCVTIAGEKDQNRRAVHLILGKISEDPHSASCPTISYVDILGPVASAYPTGSPYAMISNNYGIPSPSSPSMSTCSNMSGLNSNILCSNHLLSPNTMEHSYSLNESISSNTLSHSSSNYSANLLSVITSNTNYRTPSQSPIPSNDISDYHHQHSHHHHHQHIHTPSIDSHQTTCYYTNEHNPLQSTLVDDSLSYQTQDLTDNSALEVIRNILRISGFSDLSADAISKAIETICKYGLTNQNSTNSLNSPNHNSPLRSSNNNLTLYNSFPLYNTSTPSSTNTTTTTSNTTPTTSNTTNLSQQENLWTTNCPLEFLIQSYLTQMANKKQNLVSPVTSLESLKMDFGDGEEVWRNIEISARQMGDIGMNLESTLIKNIKTKTKTEIKLDHDNSRISEGLYSLKVSGKCLDNVLEAIGDIIYCKENINPLTSSNNESTTSNSLLSPSSTTSKPLSNTNNCQQVAY